MNFMNKSSTPKVYQTQAIQKEPHEGVLFIGLIECSRPVLKDGSTLEATHSEKKIKKSSTKKGRMSGGYLVYISENGDVVHHEYVPNDYTTSFAYIQESALLWCSFLQYFPKLVMIDYYCTRFFLHYKCRGNQLFYPMVRNGQMVEIQQLPWAGQNVQLLSYRRIKKGQKDQCKIYNRKGSEGFVPQTKVDYLITVVNNNKRKRVSYKKLSVKLSVF